ncbi:MAG: hypothetical protein MMC33_000160 [Icmadophila ericetorum]|nr:hypothetical protein [Icmadophila ericetorum]
MSTFNWVEPEAARVLAISTLGMNLQSFLASYQDNRAYMLLFSIGKLVAGVAFWSWAGPWRAVVIFEWVGASVILAGLGFERWTGGNGDGNRKRPKGE